VTISRRIVELEEPVSSTIQYNATRLIAIAQKGLHIAAPLACQARMCVERVTTSVSTEEDVFRLKQEYSANALRCTMGSTVNLKEKTSVWRKRMGNQ
jgi:hypothetical protein